MSQRELDRAIEEVRGEAVADSVVRGAAKRVFATIFDSTLRTEQVDHIRGCDDFRALLPAFLNHQLSPARVLLLQDHVSQCVACRKALRDARSGAPVAEHPESVSRETVRWSFAFSWAFAAALLIGIVIGVVGARKGLLPGQHAVRATVAAVDGSLYRITEFGARLVAVGDVIRNADELRTANGSRATLRLLNGAQLEMGERSAVAIAGNWQGATVNLEQGRLIMASAVTRNETYVSSGGLVIPVHDAILAVDSGLKGSRVAVAQGSVQVEQGQKATDVSAGQEFASDYRIGMAPIVSQFSWSRNSGAYASLLNEFASLQKEFQAIPAPGLRYSSSLAKYLPANTAIYAAIPNLGGTLTEAKRLFDERLNESDVLRAWWNQQPASKTADLDRALTQIASVSQYLGNELVLAVPSSEARESGKQAFGSPVFLAELHQSGLNDYLRQNLPASAGLRLVTQASRGEAAGKDQLFVDIDNNIVVASPDLAELRTVEAAVSGTPTSTFVQTPFYRRVAQSYSAGAGYLLAADLEQIGTKSVTTSTGPLAGFSDAQYLVLDRRDTDGATETRASLSFAADRQGIASWLGAPGPIGSISFASPDATLAVAIVTKSPRDMVSEIITFASQGDSQFVAQLGTLESATGVSLLDDIAAPLGGDAMFAIDGPLLPLPTWKLAVEVNDPERLQHSLATLVSRYNQTPSAAIGKLQLGSAATGPRVFYSLRSEKYPQAAVHYTFTDGYLLASTSEAVLNQAIQDRRAGHTLVSSSNFRNQLPADNFTNLSAVLYTNIGSALAPVADQLKASTALSPAQRRSIAALAANSGPGLICLYGEPDRIVAATRTSFLGFNLATLVGIQQGKPIAPLIANVSKN